MKQLIIGAGEGVNYDWSKDHIYVKTPADLTEGPSSRWSRTEMAPMTNEQVADPELMRALSEKYDQWTR